MIPLPLWLVIPCYNEHERFMSDVFATALIEQPGLHLCLVDDGSEDGTFSKLESLSVEFPQRVLAIRLEENSGKGEAVRSGVLQVLGNTNAKAVGYWDADLATPLDQIKEFEREAYRFPDWTALLGCRHKRLGTKIERMAYRHYLGRVFASLASPLLALPVYDTQCGAKIFKKEVATKIFVEPFCSRWCFDIELLARMMTIYGTDAVLNRVHEVSLRKWVDIDRSKVKLTDFPKMVFDLLKIKYTYGLPDYFPPTFHSE